MPQLFGGEKRLEYPAQILRRNPAARVAECQADELARRRFGIEPRLRLVNLLRRRSDQEPAALGIASRELTARFISTCSSMPRSALMEGRPGA